MLGNLNRTRAQQESLIAEAVAFYDEHKALPNFAYTSQDYLDLETEAIFQAHWMLAGRASEIPNPGDVKPVISAGHNLLMVRQQDGSIRVFHNLCPHRGAKLLSECASGVKALTCPYHAWSFAIDGSPRRRPHFYRGGQHEMQPADKGLSGLSEVRSHIWLDFVYINIDGNARPFEEWMAPVIKALEPYDFSRLTYARTIEFDLASNWKLAAENFWDTYHIFKAHPSVNAQMSMSDRENAIVDDQIIIGGYQYPEKPEGQYVGRNFTMPMHDGDQDFIKNRSWFIVCYPSNLIQVWEDALVMIEMRPVAPGRTIEWFHFYLVGEAATHDDFAENRDKVIGFMRDFQLEDMDIVSWMQEGRSSVAHRGGELSPYWDTQVPKFAAMNIEALKAASGTHFGAGQPTEIAAE